MSPSHMRSNPEQVCCGKWRNYELETVQEAHGEKGSSKLMVQLRQAAAKKESFIRTAN